MVSQVIGNYHKRLNCEKVEYFITEQFKKNNEFKAVFIILDNFEILFLLIINLKINDLLPFF